MTRDDVMVLINAERARQDAKWGAGRHLRAELWTTILAEEFGEVAKAVLEGDVVGVREELVQVAAVAICWLEAEDWKR
jgi:NTP pyrophosphatase (non-canonical NTP hydrolase)